MPEDSSKHVGLSDVAGCTAALRDYVCGHSSADQDQLQKALALYALCVGELAQLIDEATERVCAEASVDQDIETAVAQLNPA